MPCCFPILLTFLLSAVLVHAQDWTQLEKYHHTITKEKFCSLLDRIYNPNKAIYAYMNVTDEYVEMFENKEKTNVNFTLYFAKNDQHLKKDFSRTFKSIPELLELKNSTSKPLQGLKMVIDPGHIGGAWADIEERSVTWNHLPVIREGDKNLQVAQALKARLETAGAQIYLTHDKPEPVTPLRAKDFMEEAKAEIYKKYQVNEESAKSRKAYFDKLINWRAELYFYRRAEIAQRAENIRTQFLPDLNICNHFNATEKSGARQLTKDNRHVFFINGCYGPDEIENPLTRYFLFSKLLEQSIGVEIKVADAISKKMNQIANFPPVRFGKEMHQCPVNENPYLYARNLAASRQYPGPCIILEPFYMNNAWTAERLAAGDYDGVKTIAGGSYRSLIREYGDAVADAIIETYSAWTVPIK